MCGRFAFHSPRETVLRIFDVDLPSTVAPRYNIAPTQDVLAIRSSPEGVAEPVMLRWGLVPFWAKDPAIGNRMINARAETASQKPAFRAAFRRRRCIVLADGFYEWRRSDHGKTPFYISNTNGDPFAMAGLWEHWEADGASLESCAIITTSANNLLAEIHDRMPVILSPEAAAYWLRAGDQHVQGLVELLAPCPDDLLHCHEVSRAVNNPRNEGSELIESRGKRPSTKTAGH